MDSRDSCVRISHIVQYKVILTSLPDEHKVTVNPSAVNLEEAWNRREGKDRFGQPIQTPALAEDVKGDFNVL